jgi:hypothetical protein
MSSLSNSEKTEKDIDMNLKKQFWVLYIIFAVLNLIDYYSTAIYLLLPEFEKQNSLIQIIFTNETSIILELKLSLIFFAGVIGGLVFRTGKDEGLKLLNNGLIILNLILGVICAVNIIQLIYYFSL